MKKNSQVIRLKNQVKLFKMDVKEARRAEKAWRRIAQKAASAIDKLVVNIVKAIAKNEAPAAKKLTSTGAKKVAKRRASEKRAVKIVNKD